MGPADSRRHLRVAPADIAPHHPPRGGRAQSARACRLDARTRVVVARLSLAARHHGLDANLRWLARAEVAESAEGACDEGGGSTAKPRPRSRRATARCSSLLFVGIAAAEPSGWMTPARAVVRRGGHRHWKGGGRAVPSVRRRGRHRGLAAAR
jgi:hypothetical protein